ALRNGPGDYGENNERITDHCDGRGEAMLRLEERAKTKSLQDKAADLNARRAELELGGGKERIDKQHASGKLSARERVTALVDKNSFEEIGLFARHRATYFGLAGKELPADGVVTGCATIE